MGAWNEHMDDAYNGGWEDGSRSGALVGGLVVVGLGAIWYGLKYIFTDHKAKERVRALNEQLDDLKRQMPQLASGAQQEALPTKPAGM